MQLSSYRLNPNQRRGGRGYQLPYQQPAGRIPYCKTQTQLDHQQERAEAMRRKQRSGLVKSADQV